MARQNFFVKNKRSHAVIGNYIFGCGRKFFDDSILHGAVIYYSIFGGKKIVDVAPPKIGIAIHNS